MDTHALMRDMATRPAQGLAMIRELSDAELNAHPAGHPNSVAWLLWHAGRQADMQLSALSGQPELWKTQGFDLRFSLGAEGEAMGYGHSDKQARQIICHDQELLTEYIKATMDAVSAYMDTLSEQDLAEIIDKSWNPPVSRGVRLISIIDDTVAHVAQAAYIAGMPELS